LLTPGQFIRLLPEKIPLFVPDIPGYGASTPSQTSHDKRTVGLATLDALSSLLEKESSTQSKPCPIILAGHDRGARVCHRLAVDADTYADRFTVLGTILMDIVPTLVQWQGMARPAEAMGFFHWPFLSNVELATEMIQAMGGDVFIRSMFQRWRGQLTPRGLDNLTKDGALEVYEASFKQESVIRASNLDYLAGATEDVEEQTKDQVAGRRLAVPTLILYSAAGIGRRFDLPGTWQDWVVPGKDLLVTESIGDGAGHFFAEENPEETVEKTLAWFSRIGVYQ
jgi:pimeloyl-ACP methyl ester carboxylesterase